MKDSEKTVLLINSTKQAVVVIENFVKQFLVELMFSFFFFTPGEQLLDKYSASRQRIL